MLMNNSMPPPNSPISAQPASWSGQVISAAPELDEAVDVAAILGSLWRGKLWILLFAIITSSIGIYYAYFVATPIYRSQAVVMLNNREEQVIDFDSVVSGLGSEATVINSEIEVLRSRGLLGKVVDKLNLTEDPEFNRSLQPPSLTTQAITFMRTLVEGPQPERVPLSDAIIRQITISGLRTKISAVGLPQTLVSNIVVESESPQKAALIADTLVELYILNQLEVKFQATEQATTWLSGRVSDLQQELERAETRVREFQANASLISQEVLEAQDRQLKDTRDRIVAKRAEAASLMTLLEQMQAAQTRAEKAAASDDIQLQQMLARTSNTAIAETFDARFDTLQARTELEAQRAQTQLDALIASEDILEAEIAKQSEDLVQLQQLTREAVASRQLYEYFLGRLNETAALQGIQQADSRVLSNATVPIQPSAPRKSAIVILSAFLGVIFGSALVLLRESARDNFRTASGLEAATGRSVMGQIPVFPVRKRELVVKYLTEKPTSAAAEAVRNLRTSILLANVDNPPQVLAISSSVPGEGKTTLSLALAHNLVGLGKSVLLIDGDVRRRMVTYSVKQKDQDGIVSVMSGKKTLDEAAQDFENSGMHVLLGEMTSTNAADLFASERFKALLQEARSKYDHIVIDTPPVLIVPDARIIVQEADALVFVVKWNGTLRQQVIDSLKLFSSDKRLPIGVALNQISPRGMKRYGYGDRYGAYSTYGSKYYNS